MRGRHGRHPLRGGEEWLAPSSSWCWWSALALAFDYVNGFHDTANAVATVVSTGVLPPRTAVLLAAACNFVGAFLVVEGGHDDRPGTSPTRSRSLRWSSPAALVGAIAWNLLTWYYGIPSSSSHALIGGLVGAVWCHRIGPATRPAPRCGSCSRPRALSRLSRPWSCRPLAGMLGGFTLMVILTWLVLRLRPTTVNKGFRVLQLGSAGFMAVAHGSNDAQKSMGIITMALAAYASARGRDRSRAGRARPG